MSNIIGANVGNAWISVRLSMQGARADLQKQLYAELSGVGDKAGTKSGGEFSRSFGKSANLGSVGALFGRDFSRAITKNTRVDSVASKLSSLGKLKASPTIALKGAEEASSEITKLGSNIGALSNYGMPAFVGAAVALSPYLVTLGTGFAGLALAATGILKPIENAAKKTGGLQANMFKLDSEQRSVARGLLGLQQNFHGFENAVKPAVLGLFSRGLGIARSVLHDIQPVTVATGKALGGFLGTVGHDLNSGQWQSFFGWMGQQAGPDMRLFGSFLINILNTLPPLIRDLQPVATNLLDIATGTVKLAQYGAGAVGTLEQMNTALDKSGQSSSLVGRLLGAVGRSARQATNQMLPGIPVIGATAKLLGVIGQNSLKTSSGMKSAKTAMIPVVQVTDNLARKFSNLAASELNALTPLETYANDAIKARNDLANLAAALKLSHDKVGLNTQAQRNSFSTAQQYISDLQAQASSALKTGRGAQAAAKNIADGLPTLTRAAKSNATLRQEVDLLRQALENLRKERQITQSVVVHGVGQWVAPGGMKAIPGFSTGGFVRAGSSSTADDVLARLSKGELVVPARMVSAGLVDHLRGILPGFANGGIVGAYKGNVPGLTNWTVSNFSATVKAAITAIANAMAKSVAASSAGGFPSGSFGGGSPQGIAAKMLSAFGWAASQMGPLIKLWDRESGWRWNARNPSSGAYGIPQALPASKMAAAGPDWLTNPVTQIKWGLGYIKSVYGSPAGAWASEVARGWYDSGGIARGVGFLPKDTPQPERVLSPRQTSAFERLVDVIDGKSGRASDQPLKMVITGGKVGIDREGNLYFRQLAVQEARAEIQFAQGR